MQREAIFCRMRVSMLPPSMGGSARLSWHSIQSTRDFLSRRTLGGFEAKVYTFASENEPESVVSLFRVSGLA